MITPPKFNFRHMAPLYLFQWHCAVGDKSEAAVMMLVRPHIAIVRMLL